MDSPLGLASHINYAMMNGMNDPASLSLGDETSRPGDHSSRTGKSSLPGSFTNVPAAISGPSGHSPPLSATHSGGNGTGNGNSTIKQDAERSSKGSVKVKEFKLDWIPPGSNILIVGRRGVGKSHLCTQLLTRKAGVLPIVFASPYVVQRYRKYLPAANVLEAFDEGHLTFLLKRQSGPDPSGITDESSEIILAFDDVTNEGVCLMDYKTVRDIVKYGSSLDITSIFSVQHAGVYDETFRRNVDFVFIFHDNLIDDQRVLYKKYANMFSSFEEFQNIYKQCTTEAPFRCLVLNMREPWQLDDHDRRKASKAPDGVYWYSSTSDLPESSDTVDQVVWPQDSRKNDSKRDTSAEPSGGTISGSSSTAGIHGSIGNAQDDTHGHAHGQAHESRSPHAVSHKMRNWFGSKRPPGSSS